MKTRILSIFIAIAMVAMLIPASVLPAFAAEGDVVSLTVNGVTTNYTNFNSALSAALAATGSSTLKLLDDVTVSGDIGIYYGNVTLDFGGKKLTTGQIHIYEGANVTILDSGTDGMLVGTHTSRAIMNWGNLTVESGSIYSMAKAINNGGTLTVKGGTFSGGEFAVYASEDSTTVLNNGTFGGPIWTFTDFTINGGTYTAQYIGINDDNSVLNITGGTFQISEFDIYRGTVSISGGTFTVDPSEYLADGYVTSLNEGVYTVKRSGGDSADEDSDEDFVASVTVNGVTTNYTGFGDAIFAASSKNGSTLKLLDNVMLSDKTFGVESDNFTFDLSGKTLTCGGITFYEDATAIIKDTGTGGTIQTTEERMPAVDVYGKLTIESGNFIGSEYTVDVGEGGVLEVNGGTFTGDGYALYIIVFFRNGFRCAGAGGCDYAR